MIYSFRIANNRLTYFQIISKMSSLMPRGGGRASSSGRDGGVSRGRGRPRTMNVAQILDYIDRDSSADEDSDIEDLHGGEDGWQDGDEAFDDDEHEGGDNSE